MPRISLDERSSVLHLQWCKPGKYGPYGYATQGVRRQTIPRMRQVEGSNHSFYSLYLLLIDLATCLTTAQRLYYAIARYQAMDPSKSLYTICRRYGLVKHTGGLGAILIFYDPGTMVQHNRKKSIKFIGLSPFLPAMVPFASTI